MRWGRRAVPQIDERVRAHAEAFHGGSGATGVVFCHGFTGSPHSLRPLAEQVAAAGFRVSVPLLPGHGTSWHHLNTTTWRDWYAEVDDAFRALRADCDSVFAVGLSMGGSLALRLAAEHPAGVRGLVLVNPALTTTDRRFLALPVLSRAVGSLAGITDDIAKPGVSEFGYDRVPLRALLSMTRLWADVRERLPRVRQPVLVFRSAVDHVVDPSSVALLHARIGSTDVTERVLDRSYHVATLDYDAEDIAAETVEFLRRHDRGVEPETPGDG